MIYAPIGGERRQPLSKGERATCPGCGAALNAVLPRENIRHWRHKGGDCDSWSEPEGEWHLGWKETFPIDCREISMRDPDTGELHRADVLCRSSASGRGVVLELQQSPISEAERVSRERFYMREHRMFWLVNVHDSNTFRAFSFAISLSFKKPTIFSGRTFYQMDWMGPSKQFIEKWKDSAAHVFFYFNGSIYYLATRLACEALHSKHVRGEFSLARLTDEEFIAAVQSAM
jgi:hypothetical protein